MLDVLFNEISVVVITAGVLSLLLYLLRQPLIIAYIATGLLIGPSLLGLASSNDVFAGLSQIGIAFLLFLVGLNLNWQNIKDVGKVAILAGLGQVIFTTGIGFFIALAFGFEPVVALLLALAFAFSSTIIIVKLLSDKEDIGRFYGRISVGILIVQDLVAMVLLLVIGAFSSGGSLGTILALAALKAILVLCVLYLLAKYVLPHVFAYAARSQELLFLTAVSWCFAVASSLQFIGFGIEIGALLAGLSLAGSQFHREIESKIRPLRDFFLVIFFIVLGTHLTLGSIGMVLVPALVFSAFILIGNPLIVLAILRLGGYHPRTGFMVGVTMAQVSEFSFILLTVAIASGLTDDSVLPLATMVGLITIGISTYLIKYNETLYQRLEWAFRWLEKKPDKERVKQVRAPEVLVFGYEHLARAMMKTIKSLKQDYLVVDFDPSVIKELKKKRIPAMYGDAGNEDFLRELKAEKAKILISTIPDFAVSSDIIAYVKSTRKRPAIVVTAKTAAQAESLYEAGATFVILPNMLGGELFAQMLKKKQLRKRSWNALAKKQKKVLAS